MSSRGSASEEPLPYDEDFLFHLSRGSEFLIANRVDEAKEELERALVFQPRDAKGQDLLAGVYFRLGVYPRAIELWGGLVDVYPDDVPLRVNLGLALLKTAHLEGAVQHLTRATSLDESHARAWGYLGLALWREGRLDRARDAFVRGGQASMARRMEEMLGLSAAGHVAPSLSVVPPPMDADAMPERRSAPPAWRHEASPPEPGAIDQAERISHPPSLRSALERWALRLPDGLGLGLTDSGALVVRPVHAAVAVARAHTVAVRGGAASGKDEPYWLVGPGQQAIVHPPEAHTIHTLVLADAEVFYVAERALLAYDGAAGGDARTIELGAVSVRVVALRGRASVALACRGRPVALATDGAPLHVAVTQLVGWSGHLFPSATRGSELVTMRGDGIALIA